MKKAMFWLSVSFNVALLLHVVGLVQDKNFLINLLVLNEYKEQRRNNPKLSDYELDQKALKKELDLRVMANNSIWTAK